jgi:hypothetical protein
MSLRAGACWPFSGARHRRKARMGLAHACMVFQTLLCALSFSFAPRMSSRI